MEGWREGGRERGARWQSSAYCLYIFKVRTLVQTDLERVNSRSCVCKGLVQKEAVTSQPLIN
jgi:hypothetical protein